MTALLAATPVVAHAAGQITITGESAGPTPFIAYLYASVSGASLSSASFTITPASGSLTRPITATATATYLAAHGALNGDHLIVPVFGLYAGRTNTVELSFSFADGSSVQTTIPVTAAAYTDPCAEVNQGVFENNRTTTDELNFDYFLVKDYCSANSPAIFDTDGVLRWVGIANAGSLPGLFYGNGIYTSDTKTGINRLDLFGLTTKIADFSAESVTSTNPHNIDPGRNGLIDDVNTTTEDEAAAIEFDPTSGAVLQQWDMGQIIGAAMTAGGDDPSQFVFADGKTDWFHMNSTAYNPADDTLIVSSRENFVIAVDYDVPSDGVRKIHWILGDTTKHWYQFASLRKFALTPTAGTLVPIGQHAVSIDGAGNLLLFDDGYGSQFQSPPGITRGYSVIDSYRIDTGAMTASTVFDYQPQPSIYSYICGSAYDAGNGSHLVDFATAASDETAEIQGLGTGNTVVFDLKLPETNFCSVGWNASPIPSVPIMYR